MNRPVRWLFLLLILAACRESGSDTKPRGTPDVAARTDSAGLEGNEPGVEFEAPRLIPAIRAQLLEIEGPQGAVEGKIAALQGGLDTLVRAMRADLLRVGAADTAGVYALGDSLLGKLGGDTVGQVERLIQRYEEAMRKAAD